MNRRLGGDASLNAPISNEGEAGEWQDWLCSRHRLASINSSCGSSIGNRLISSR
jgi:hypothetical protein